MNYWYEKIINNYPDLFRYCQYIECSKGWKDLIVEACEGLTRLNIPDMFFFQIKEKFGGLRLYVSTYTEEAKFLISDLESKSFHVCEACGEPGKTYNIGYIQTLCKNCYAEFVEAVKQAEEL